MAESLALKGLPKKDKLEYILEVTSKCFEDVGYNQITMDFIAERAEVSKGTLTYYFRSKEGLISSLIQHHAVKLLKSLRDGIDKAVTPEEKLRIGVELIWNAFYHDSERLRAYRDLSAQAFFNSNLRTEIVRVERDMRELLVGPIRDILSAKPAFNEKAVAMRAGMIIGAIGGLVQQIVLDPESFSVDDVEAGCEDIFRFLVGVE
ncbi:MAG: TetR/AcrR family transcriptional regulator [Desulfuromusa sp.]|nr:TetR/AcrR family transcriptional regulator [Desulfuromusa sp.]